MKNTNEHGSFFRSLGLLIKTLFFALGYAALWLGITFIDERFGTVMLTAGAVVSAFAVLSCIIAPLSRMKK